MITPEQLKELPEEFVKTIQSLEDYIIGDIARRIAKQGELTDTAIHQVERAASYGIDVKEIEKEIQKRTKASIKDIDNAIRETISSSIDLDNTILKQAGFDTVDWAKNTTLTKLVEAGIRQTKGELKSLTGSMGFRNIYNGKFEPIREFYIKTMDYTSMLVQSGTADYITATRMATKSMTEKGLEFVDYESGHINRTDVAARRAIITGVNQINAQMTNILIEQVGCEYVEVTAHMGARPSHREWQGRVFHVGGSKDGYPDFESNTRYGSVDGLCGANCRHSYFMFFPGISTRAYTQEQLDNIDPPPFKYKGKEYTYYDATQRQRALERSIRKTKRELSAADGAGDKDMFLAKSIKLNTQKQEYKTFSSAANIRTKTERTQELVYGRSIAQKSVQAVRKELEKYTKFHYNKDGTIVVTDDWKNKTHVSVPRKYKPYAVIEIQNKNGNMQIDMTMYDKDGWKLLELHSGDHSRPKFHKFGDKGEHSHLYVWDKPTEVRIDRITRELLTVERKWISDLL